LGLSSPCATGNRTSGDARSSSTPIIHYNLKFLLDQKLATIPQHQGVSKLLGFDFSVEYKPGAANVVADTLSRCDWEVTPSILALSALMFELFDDL
jgi:hypothetical protein